MYFISISAIKDTEAKSVKIGLLFFPLVIIGVGIVMFGKFESHFRRYHPKYFTNIYTNYSMFIMILVKFLYIYFLDFIVKMFFLIHME